MDRESYKRSIVRVPIYLSKIPTPCEYYHSQIENTSYGVGISEGGSSFDGPYIINKGNIPLAYFLVIDESIISQKCRNTYERITNQAPK